MKKHILLYFLINICLLIGIFIIVCLQFHQNWKSREQLVSEMENEFFMENIYMQDNIAAAVQCNGLPICLQNNQFKSPKIVCYYSAQSCEVCINYAKKMIEEYFPESYNDSLVLYLAAKYPANYQFREKNTINIGKQKLNLPIEDTDRVFYFVIENDLVEHIFMPERQFDGYTQVYLKQIQKRYVNDTQ